ncbi:MAG: isocitrate lyase/phosphoenolpyruvate mutase family protein [Ginsengibacter sp.]
MQSQKSKADLFRDLHNNGKMLVLPNIWDPLGAALLEELAYPAIATASASIAFVNGYDDGENIPFTDLLILLKKITSNVQIPVTADIESGFADTNADLQKNIELLIETGIVGINIEDTDKKNNKLFPIEIQCERINLIKRVAVEMGIPLFINARTDVYINTKDFINEEEKFNETVHRGKAYMKAGADCFFPVLMTQQASIQNLISELICPINIITIAGVPDLKILNEMGVARVSLGPGFLKIAIRTMKEIAERLKNYEGIEAITGNEITTDYLKSLVDKN